MVGEAAPNGRIWSTRTLPSLTMRLLLLQTSARNLWARQQALRMYLKIPPGLSDDICHEPLQFNSLNCSADLSCTQLHCECMHFFLWFVSLDGHWHKDTLLAMPTGFTLPAFDVNMDLFSSGSRQRYRCTPSVRSRTPSEIAIGGVHITYVKQAMNASGSHQSR